MTISICICFCVTLTVFLKCSKLNVCTVFLLDINTITPCGIQKFDALTVNCGLSPGKSQN